MPIRRIPPGEPVFTITYGYLTVKDGGDREVELMFCHRCGGMIPPRGQQVHTDWHRALEQG